MAKVEYKTLWEFQVDEYVQNGITVFCTDRQNRTTFEVNDMPWNAAMKLLADAKAESDAAPACAATRFEFWYEQEVEEQGGKENDAV